MGPLGFGERLLRFVFVGPDRRFTKTLLDMPIPRIPDPDVLANLMPALAGVLAEREPGTTVACLITRPGRGPVTDIDRKWAMVVRAHAEHVDVPLEPIFRANDESVLQVEDSSLKCYHVLHGTYRAARTAPERQYVPRTRGQRRVG